MQDSSGDIHENQEANKGEVNHIVIHDYRPNTDKSFFKNEVKIIHGKWLVEKKGKA